MRACGHRQREVDWRTPRRLRSRKPRQGSLPSLVGTAEEGDGEGDVERGRWIERVIMSLRVPANGSNLRPIVGAVIYVRVSTKEHVIEMLQNFSDELRRRVPLGE
jgi:hypothetical protein